ncbi:MAG: hypothetical protein II875_11870 [Clostridia bacterium]|nr:hypothetical protein [Clostridia bacterium]
MRKTTVLLFILILCFGNSHAEYGHIEKVGETPKEFALLVSENRFHDTFASNGRLLEYERTDEGIMITERDIYGTEIAQIPLNVSSGGYQISVAATSDGGYLVLYGFYDRYDKDAERWNYSDGVRSYVFKLDATGKIEWQFTATDLEYYGLYRIFECPDGYLFFGHQGEQAKKRSGYNPATSICITKLDRTGSSTQTLVLGGSDFDMLDAVVPTDEGTYKLYVCSQSKDGDFEISEHLSRVNTEWEIILDANLNILSKQPFDRSKQHIYFDYQIRGYIDSLPVYRNDERLKPIAYPDSVLLIVDYEDFYVIVSEHDYAEYPYTPILVSATWYLTETVYSAYDQSGTLLWRDAVESSPDYASYN